MVCAAMKRVSRLAVSRLRAVLIGAGSILDILAVSPLVHTARPRAASAYDALMSDSAKLGGDFRRALERERESTA